MFIFVFLNFSPTILWFVVFTLGANWRIGYWYKIDAWTECCCILPRTPSCVTTPALSTTHLSSDAARTTTCATAIWNPSCTSATPQVITKPKSDGNCLFVALCPLLTLEEFDFRQTKQNKKKWLLSIWLFFYWVSIVSAVGLLLFCMFVSFGLLVPYLRIVKSSLGLSNIG